MVILLQWDVTQLSNGRYTIANHHHHDFACCDNRANRGDNIYGLMRMQQWVITETRVRGQYTSVYFIFTSSPPGFSKMTGDSISPTDASICLFWSLPYIEMDSPVRSCSMSPEADLIFAFL